jgi:membrane protease YdiL (CAAX protease family)
LIYPLIKSTFFDFDNFIYINWNTTNSFIIWLFPSITYAFFEEIGWRGFLLPHLQDTFSAWKSTIILTIIWALWHFPFFFYRFDFSIGISIGFFFGIFVGSIILTSLYNSNRGALLPVILFHFFNNLCSEVDKEIIVAVLSTGFVFMSIYIFKKLGKTNLSNTSRQINYFIS